MARCGVMATKTATHTPSDWDLKLGKTPARKDATLLKLSTYAPTLSDLPRPPASGFGHYGLVRQYPMYGNDQYGCCVESGAGHEHQSWVATGRGTVSFTDTNILEGMYGPVTGWTPDDPDSDQGTDMELAAKWRRKVGLPDSAGSRHKIAAYADLEVNKDGVLDRVAVSAYVFGAAGVGIEFPAFAMDQFNRNGQHTVWDVARTNTKIEGGHYIPILGRDANGNFVLVTWGTVIRATPKFLLKYMDEGLVYFSKEVLYQGRNVEGLNQTKLLGDLRQVASVRAIKPSDTVAHGPSKPHPVASAGKRAASAAAKKAPAKAAVKAPAKKAPARKAPAKKAAPKKRGS